MQSSGEVYTYNIFQVRGYQKIRTMKNEYTCGKKHFENSLGKPPKVTHEPITKFISNKLDIKIGQFTQEELHSVLRKIKNRKEAGLDEILPEVWKTRDFDDIQFR